MRSKGDVGPVETGHSLAQRDACFPRGRRTLYAWRSMEIGDSFVTNKKSVAAAAAYFSRRNPEFKFAVRKIDASQWRVWRVEA